MSNRRVAKPSMEDQKGFSKLESGTCNVCSSPCSSCMHRNVGFTGSKSNESSDENGHGVADSQCSVNEDGLSPSSLVNARNSSNNTASEASNLVNSSYDALSENAESKETIRCSGISDDSRAAGMTSKTSFSGGKMKHKVSGSDVLCQRSNCIEDQEDGVVSDGRTKNLKSGYLTNEEVNKDSATTSVLISDPILGGSSKDQDSTMIESSNALLNEVKPQSLHNPPSNHEDRISSEQGKLEAGGNNDREEPSVEGSTPSGQNGKSSKNTSLNKSDEPIASASSESDDSEMVELDIKVCDICGDAGREDLLAICSGCPDGAEHIYCMRKRLEEVPEGDWLCEECQFAEEAEKQKKEAKRKRETEVPLNIQSSGKRHVDKIEAAADAKRQTVEGSTGPPKKSTLSRIGVLSRETSFKGLDRSRGKLNHQTSFTDDTEGPRSTGSHLQPPKGALLKSSSFNFPSSKPKVQLMDDVSLQRKKTVKECSSVDINKGCFRNVGKSMSSRTIDAGRSVGNDSQAKMPASKEGKSSKQRKDRSTEANENCSVSEQSSSQADCEDKRTSTSCVGEDEGVPINGNIASHDGLPRSREFREVGKKSKETIGKRQRSSLLSGAKGVPSSQKGGQTAESSDTSGGCDSDPSTTRNVREDINNGNKLRAAVDAALRRKPSFAKNRGLEQSDVSMVSNVDSSSGKTTQNQLPSKMHKNYVSHKGLQGGHPTLWPASDPNKQTIVTNEKHLVLSGADAMPPPSVGLEVNFPSLKPVIRDLPLVPPPALLASSAIPDHESIWQGYLEVRKTGNQSVMLSGMQAHLSTLASPKVVEVVNKFPEKFSLNEVSRISTWPAQFQDVGTKEDHIALFFFAKDIESYEINYKPLVDNMVKKDLALKGSLDNVELLIFASNQLPPNCQRWNMFYFLWGVFLGRKETCTNPQSNTSLPTSNILPTDQDSNDLSQTGSPFKHLEKASSLLENSNNRIETQNMTDVFNHVNPSDRESSIEKSLSTKEEIACKEDAPGATDIPCQANGSNSEDGLVKKVQQIEIQELDGGKDLPLTVTDSKIHPPGQDKPLEKDLNVNQASHRKRPIWELTGPATENSSVMNQIVDLNNDGLFEESPNKKQKIENENSSSFSQETSGIMKKSPEFVFPLDLNAEREDIDEMDEDIVPLDNNNNNNKRLVSGTVPDLELALGAEETTEETMGLLPFLTGRANSVEESMNKGKQKEEEEEDDDVAEAASLALSLSFPGEEKKNVNTPFFLFKERPR